MSTPGKIEKYAWPRWELNLRPLEYYSPYSPEYITPTQKKIMITIDYIDIEGTRLSSEISHTRTGLTA
jgi:hypothetical protein